MLSFNYKLTSYQTFLQELAGTLGVEMQEDFLYLPESVGEGFLRAIGFKEADALLYAFKLKDDFIFKRQKDEKEYYTLIYDELLQPENFSIQIGSDVLMDSSTRTSAIYLTGFLYDIEYTLYKDVFIRGARICLNKDWMRQYLRLPSIEDVLEKYIGMKTVAFISKFN